MSLDDLSFIVYLYLNLSVGYFFAPLVAGVILGQIQKYLFLRDNRLSYRWWPIATAIGLSIGAFFGIILLYLLAAIIYQINPDPKGLIILIYSIMLFCGSFGAIGIISSLFQFWLLGKKAVPHNLL